MLEKILSYFQNKEEIGLVKAAFELAQKAHKGQIRDSGELFIQHPLNVALTLTKMNLDTETIVAALLHDVVEDTAYPLKTIEEQFGKTVAFLVDGVTKFDKIEYGIVEGKAENLRKLFLAMARDIRVVLIKLADRFHNMQTLWALPEKNQKRIALETLEIYAPIAHRLGMGELKGQLEDLAFKFIHPKEFINLEREVTRRYEAHKNYIAQLEPKIAEALKKEKITPLEINTRAKHFYSLYKKLIRHQMNFDKIHDLVAARIIVNNIEECYLALGAIHQIWRPVPGLIKDYIALPKPNGYQSLHTTIFGPAEKMAEIQIRTPEMHEKAENGIAAHWAYKEKQFKTLGYQKINEKELAWIDQLRDWQKAVRGTDDFFDSLKIDFFKDRIFALTPKGDILDLPENATPVDFAYQVHTDIGNECTGAKINGKIVPLDSPLQSGDLVEIMTQKGKKPPLDWLGFVKTNLAKEKIKSASRKKHLNFVDIKNAKSTQTEIKLVVKDRIGLIKDIAKIIAGKKINIISLTTENKNKNFPPIISVILNLKDKNKLQNLALELKKTKGVEEINYK